MSWWSIIIVIIIIVLLYFVLAYLFSSPSNLVTNVSSGTSMQTIAASKLPDSNSTNFTYSMWFYVNDWNYKYGQEKILFGRLGTAPSSSTTTTTGNGSTSVVDIRESEPCPFVTLGAIENDLNISLTCYSDLVSNPDDNNVSTKSNYLIHTCNVKNVPIQKWVNVLLTTYGRTLDVYVDGKLVKTCILPGVPFINSNASVYIVPAGGFSGWISKFQYFPKSTNPQRAWNIYQAGYGSSSLSGLFSNYKVSLVISNENGSSPSSYPIN